MTSQIKYCLDANVLITAWRDDYPPDIFPNLWKLLIENKHEIIFPEIIYNEIDPNYNQDRKKLPIEKLRIEYPLRVWIEENQFRHMKAGAEVEAIALELERTYQTKEHGTGANKNDIHLIAFAKQYQLKVVTLEGEQPQRPNKISKCKIPLICKEQDINCINFVQLLRSIIHGHQNIVTN